jgi:hypothetical protein
MTANLLADYPDVFSAGSIHSGPPAQCSTTGITNTNCTSGTVSRTPQQWGDLVRNSYPGYTGAWPRVAVWQGSSDGTVNPAAMTESRDQWTNVWGISRTPSSTATLPGGTTKSVYNDSSGVPAVVTFSISGMGHGLAVDPGAGATQCGTASTYYLDSICSSYYTALFFGLDGGSATPSPTGPTPTSTPIPTSNPCFTTDNYHQTLAGRAHQSLGRVYANGSNQAMGLFNLAVVHTLKQTGPDYYEVADGTC